MVFIRNIVELDTFLYGCELKPDCWETWIEVILDVTDQGRWECVNSYPDEIRSSLHHAINGIRRDLKDTLKVPEEVIVAWY